MNFMNTVQTVELIEEVNAIISQLKRSERNLCTAENIYKKLKDKTQYKKTNFESLLINLGFPVYYKTSNIRNIVYEFEPLWK